MQINILKLDETKYWRSDIAERGKLLLGVYLYNPGVGVHCCELTPSYELHFAGVAIGRESVFDTDAAFDHEHKIGGSELDELRERARETFTDLLRDGIADNDDVTYMHCSVVERKPKLNSRDELAVGWAEFGNYGDEGDTPEECMEAAMEYLRGNGFTDT